jgi:hypothetical protein
LLLFRIAPAGEQFGRFDFLLMLLWPCFIEPGLNAPLFIVHVYGVLDERW